jgi:hypothetical protein
MDPFTALGVAAAVVQFVELGIKVGGRMLGMYIGDTLDSNEYFQRTTEDLNDFLALWEQRLKLAGAAEATQDTNDEVRDSKHNRFQ